MNLNVLSPHNDLKSLITAYISFENESEGLIEVQKSFFPIGDQFLIIVLEGSLAWQDRGKKSIRKLEEISIQGYATAFSKAIVHGPFKGLAVQLKPYANYRFFNLNMKGLKDSHVSLKECIGEESNILYADLKSVYPEFNTVLDNFFFAQLKNRRVDVKRMNEVINYITLMKGNVSIDEISEKFFITERTLERLFERMVGINPKLFCNIQRFNHTIHLLLNDEAAEWRDIEQLTGYFDQSHFIKDFVKFTNLNPHAFHQDFKLTKEHLRKLLSL